MQTKLANLAAVLRFEAEDAKVNCVDHVRFSIGTIISVADKLDEAVGLWQEMSAELERVTGKPAPVAPLCPTGEPLNVALWVRVAAEMFGVDQVDIMGPGRVRAVSTVRSLIMYTMHQAGHNNSVIGRMMRKTTSGSHLAVGRIKAALDRGTPCQIGNTEQTMAQAVKAYELRIRAAESLQKFEVTE